MKKPKEYKCKYANYNPLTEEYVGQIGFTLPEVYLNPEGMVKLAIKIKEDNKQAYCRLPIDNCLEGENIGAIIQYDKSPLGPRKGEDLFEKPEDFLELPSLDPSKGRMAQVLKACQMLVDQGYEPVIDVRGFFDVMNTLTDLSKVLMGWAKKTGMEEICEKMKSDLIRYFLAGEKAGCRFFMFTDASGGLGVLGPRYAKKVVEGFTYPLLKELTQVLKEDTVIQLCPKTAFMIEGLEKARWVERPADKDASYFSAYIADPVIRLTGQRCSKEISRNCGGRVHYLELL